MTSFEGSKKEYEIQHSTNFYVNVEILKHFWTSISKKIENVTSILYSYKYICQSFNYTIEYSMFI